MTGSATIQAAHRIFLRACATLRPEDWDGQEAPLKAVDAEGWEHISKLAVQFGLLGLVARNLAWANERTGVAIPVLARITVWRQGQLMQMLAHRKAARRIGEALTAAGIRFVVFKGMALADAVYGDLSLRAFRDCDIFVDRNRLETAYAILQDLGYSLALYESLQDYLVRDKAGANMSHSDGSSVDLHWAIQGYEMGPSDPEIIWRHCRPPEPSQGLPGWRMSPELTLINVAAHYQVHEYEEFKSLVDFYLTAVKLGERIDPDELFKTLQVLNMRQTVDIAARLCQRFFIPNPLVERLAAGPPSLHARLACRILTEKSLLRLDKIRPTERRLRGLICSGAVASSARAFRKMLLPKARELELRFGRSFDLGMYPKYYIVQAYRLFGRTRKPFSDLA